MISLAKRNILVFFKDKAAVFFSLLAVFIIIGLYALFLGEIWEEGFSELKGVKFLMNSWIVSGLLTVTSLTSCMGAFGVVVNDKVRKISKDLYSSPLKKSSITGGYIVSSYVIGVIMSLVTLVLCQAFIVISGGSFLPVDALLKVLGLILLSTFTNVSIVLFLSSFVNSESAFTAVSTVTGTLVGFLTGIYLPIGQLAEPMQWVIKLFPVSHGAALFRQVIMEVPMSRTFDGAPAEAVSDFEQLMGVTYQFGDTTAPQWASLLVLLGTGMLFFVLAMVSMARKRK